MSIEAEWRSKCAACGEWIEEGALIDCDEEGNWIHKECHEDDLDGS